MISTQRWATFSVIAHKDPRALAREVLLYDQLIFPSPPNEEERRRWEKPERDWDPDLLDRRIEQLQGLARRLNWDKTLQGRFHDLMASVRHEVTPLAATPMVLRDWIEPQVRERGICVVAAFRDEDTLRRNYLDSATGAANSTSFTLGLFHELVVPFVDLEPEEALVKAINLARDEEFLIHRRDYYRWQEEVAGRIAGGEVDIPSAIQELKDKVAVYNRRVRSADKKARKTIIVTIAGTAASIAAALLGPPGWASYLACSSAALPLLLIERPDVSTEGISPALMFHDMRRALT